MSLVDISIFSNDPWKSEGESPDDGCSLLNAVVFNGVVSGEMDPEELVCRGQEPPGHQSNAPECVPLVL